MFPWSIWLSVPKSHAPVRTWRLPSRQPPKVNSRASSDTLTCQSFHKISSPTSDHPSSTPKPAWPLTITSTRSSPGMTMNGVTPIGAWNEWIVVILALCNHFSNIEVSFFPIFFFQFGRFGRLRQQQISVLYPLSAYLFAFDCLQVKHTWTSLYHRLLYL